jgi:hypothetical protein
MSAPEPADPETLERAFGVLEAALDQPHLVDDEALRNLLSLAVRLYSAKAGEGMRTPLPEGGGGVTVDDAMVTVTDLLHALNVQLFELSMWQAMSGNSIAPHQRVDAPG